MRDCTRDEHSLSSANGWSNRKSKQNNRGHATCLCGEEAKRLGRTFDRHRNRLQQQRTGQHWLFSFLPQLRPTPHSSSHFSPTCHFFFFHYQCISRIHDRKSHLVTE